MPPSKRVAAKRRKSPAAAPRRLDRQTRERLIVDEAIRYFSEVGFDGDTRGLATRLGITQPLLYRYFPTKDALIERVYQEVFINRWDPAWETLLADRSQPLRTRLLAFYKAYARAILHPEWIRIFLYSGLRGWDLNQRYLKLVRDRIYTRIAAELRHAAGARATRNGPHELEIELVRTLNEKIFYYGLRKWVYGTPVPDDVEAVIEADVDAFLDGVPQAVRTRIAAARRK
jgi:AcrR family transcriptional regulator